MMCRRVKIFALPMVLALWAVTAVAFGATYTVTPSQSASAIQGVISAASAGDTVVFAAGTFNISQALNLKCGVTYTGPAASPATAILSASFTRESTTIFRLSSGSGRANPCTQPTTIEYLNFENAGGIYVQTSFTNLTITHNQFTNLPCCNNSGTDNGIYFDGTGVASNTTAILSGTSVTWNTFGDPTSCETPSTGNMENTGVDNAGNCAAMRVNSTVNGLVFEYNKIVHIGEGVPIGCPSPPGGSIPCEPTSTMGEATAGVTTSNVTARYNDFAGVHRIAWEEQPQVTSGVDFEYNSYHDPYVPFFGNFDLSFACCENGAQAPYLTVNNNVLIQNVATGPCPSYIGPGIEAHGTQASFSNNLVQGLNGARLAKPPCTSGPYSIPGIEWGFGANPRHYDNNYVCGPYFNGQYIVTENPSYATPSSIVGNVFATNCTATTSVAPAISPSPGGYSSPLTVTLTDPGYTSGAQPLGNTSIYYTTDGSTPVPGSGTTQLYTLPITVSLPATIKAVGMWGSGANALSYPSGYGFVPSAVQTAAYTTSGGVTLASVSIAATGGVSALNVGGTVQMIVTCHYSDGSANGCNTVDSRGNSVTSWASSNGDVTISASGLATGAAIGSAMVTATVTGGFVTSPAYALTVSALPLTLSSVSLATSGGVSAITAGTTNQLLGTCHYSDGSTTNCGAAMDSHGNVIGSWNSSVAMSATVNGTGNVTGVAAGSTNLSASVTPAPGQLGTNLYTTAGHTANGYINYTYAVTGTATFTPTTCSIYMSGAQTVGDFWDCLLVLAPTPTTQASSPICTARYTITSSTGPGANVSFPITGCGTIPPNTAVWVGSTTNQPGTPAQGFNNCGGSCAGGVPTQGSGTYPYYYVPNTFGTYTGMTTQLIAGGATQTSQYVTVTAPPVTSANLPLTVNAAPPTLVSAYLTASGNSLVVPNTLQMAAKCHYSSGADQDCTVADIYGDAVTSWASSDVTKATVNTSGLVTAVAAGTPGITAVINGGPSSTSYSITITNPPVALTGVSLSTAGGVTGLFVGSTNQLKATCAYSDGSSDDCTTTDAHGNTAGSYTSSSSSHATVGASTGLVSGIAAGTTNLSATAGSFSSPNLPLTVLAVPTGIYSITIKGPVTFSGTVHF